MTRIAIVGMGCVFPEAGSPLELWRNALAGRRAFRRLPDERLRLADYWAPDPTAPDRFYSPMAAVIQGYEFDRLHFRVPGGTYRSTDLTHWLALDVAARALADAGFPDGRGLPTERTAVIVGNTLTGEFTRANVMRLRWPYVSRVLAAALRGQGWDDRRLDDFLRRTERSYKEPFPPVNEDTLAGSLSNTIAGRICNHFDLKGGGYTVDGACSSSLLSVVTACRNLVDGDVDVAIAGGVDLSLDPFEIVGFAKTGALARTVMRVYDRGSNGFWPGEGCGMVVLMRLDEARAAGHRVYATIAGWGVSSDGRGGITRPEVSGYQLALRRAYERAGFGLDTVPVFEGHGTGTEIGDATELRALGEARRAAGPAAPPAAISSIKALIGHTKAAAGVAGLIKATMAVHDRLVPPTAGCVDPHPELLRADAALRMTRTAEPWPAEAPVRAGVSAMGFGGINTHIVIEGSARRTRVGAPPRRSTPLPPAAQDVELLLLAAASVAGLRERVGELIPMLPRLSFGQLADLAASLHRQPVALPYRVAVVADSPEGAQRRLATALHTLDSGRTDLIDPADGVFLGHVTRVGRVGLLFPGQGSGTGTDGGALRRRLAEVDEVYRAARLPAGGGAAATEFAQPRIVTGSMAGLAALTALGLAPTVAVGHSLGEITALHWAGALDRRALLRVATARGAMMATAGLPGTMASLGAGGAEVQRLLTDDRVVIAGLNGPRQTVVAGPRDAVRRVGAAASAAGLSCVALPVSHAFHSPLMEPAARLFAPWIAEQPFAPLTRKVISTVTGDELTSQTDPHALLTRQITAPVRFAAALTAAATDTDLFIEVGPGCVLSRIARDACPVPTVALDTDDQSLTSLLTTVAAAYVRGAPVTPSILFRDRWTRDLDLNADLQFFANPCERAPRHDTGHRVAVPRVGDRGGSDHTGHPVAMNGASAPAGADPAGADPAGADPASADPASADPASADPASADPAGADPRATGSADLTPDRALEVLRQRVARHAELPVAAVDEHTRLLDSLHLSSIAVGQIVNEAARELGLSAVHAPTNFATATVRELADALADLAEATPAPGPTPIAGIAPWVRVFATELVTMPPPRPVPGGRPGDWQVYAEPGHPFAGRLRQELEAAGVGSGVLVCLPADCPEERLDLALAGVRAAVRQPPGARLVLTQHGRGAAGLAKTARIESPRLITTIVDIAPTADAVSRVITEVAATTGFVEVGYDAAGVRRVPVLRAVPDRSTITIDNPTTPRSTDGSTDDPTTPRSTDGSTNGSTNGAVLGPDDVLLVTGGGKGITAECAFHLATESGARMAVLGRSDPAADGELAGNLARARAAGVRVHYVRADVTDPAASAAAVDEVRDRLGPVTAVLHGAGHNEPIRLSALDESALRRTLAPKLDGLRAVLRAIDPHQLRLLLTFGSIIGRTGLDGEGHYAVANERLADLTREWAARYPRCRSVCLEWSVWSGIGMGERLSVVETLLRRGITPITPDDGVAALRRVLADPDAPTVVVVSGRVNDLDTVVLERPELPLLRFLERGMVHYAGVELIVEADLDPAKDPYLSDHDLDGDLLFPAVFGLEAMAQVATALSGRSTMPRFERVEFTRPITVPQSGSRTIRIAALGTDEQSVEVAIRSEETGFAADHFRATLRFQPTDDRVVGPERDRGPEAEDQPIVSLDPGRELYGDVLFQGARFQRLLRYRRIGARHAEADVLVVEAAPWFSRFLPGDLLLGDPGARDAYLHGIQVCVPDATLLPVGVERICPAGPKLPAGDVTFTARERRQVGDTYLYDVSVRDGNGNVVETWTGLRLEAVRKRDGQGPWAPALLGSLLERRLADRLGVPVAVAVHPHLDGWSDGSSRRALTGTALSQALGRPVVITYRADGRPRIDGGMSVSAAHTASVTLAVAATQLVTCDVEAVASRPVDTWADLLGGHLPLAELLRAEAAEDFDVAATRVWCAMECLQKAAVPPTGPLSPLPGDGRSGWVALRSGRLRITTFVTSLRGTPGRTVFAFLTGQEG